MLGNRRVVCLDVFGGRGGIASAFTLEIGPMGECRDYLKFRSKFFVTKKLGLFSN
jgi:hypothetical protein